ncbi:MAG: hypothetical protein Hals2KO_14850 [Halioglobus sp.]
MKLIDILVGVSLISLIQLTPEPASASEYETIRFSVDDVVCTFAARPHFGREVRLSKPSREARKSVEWLSDYVGIHPNFEVMAGKFESGASPVAFAAIHDSVRFIVYDVDIMYQSAKNTVTWRDLGVMAHEMGHHISGATTLGTKSPHDGELEADRAAGHLLRLLGASVEQALSMASVFSSEGSLTHPPRQEREEAIIDGWENAQAVLQATR